MDYDMGLAERSYALSLRQSLLPPKDL